MALAGEGDLADDAAAERDAHALGLGGVADLEAHAQVVAAVVEEEDGEDAVVDDGANELGGALEKGFEVERGVERVGQAEKVVEVGGFDTGVDGVEMSVRIGWVGGAIVALKLVRMGRTMED